MEIKELYNLFLNSTGVCTDTRKISKGNIFFALKGPNFNANQLAKEALEKGASHAVIDDKSHLSEHCILVEDCLEALQKLARYHREQFNIPVLGITGSNGKTTTKELIASVLQTQYNIHFTKGNLNNHIGVPLTILSMPKDTELAIIEMGANHIGEIADLCEIANPTYGIITNIGKAHLEGFGSLEGVAKGKSELYLHVLKHGKNIFYNTQDEHLKRMASRFEAPMSYPDKESYCHCELTSSYPTIELKYEQTAIKTNLIGAYNFPNTAAAICIGKFFGISTENIKKGIEGYNPTNNRSQVLKLDSNAIILDAYNANPTSMRAAILNLDQAMAAHKAVILGDMYELGTSEEQEHRTIGELLSECTFEKVFLCGKLMKYAAQVYPAALHFDDREELKSYLQSHPLKDFTILVKGSRGMGLENLFEITA